MAGGFTDASKHSQVVLFHRVNDGVVELEALYQGLCHRYSCGSSRAAGPQRIAYIGGRGVGGKYSGIETYYEETGERLALMGYDVTAYCRTYFTPRATERRGIRIVRLPTIRSKHLDTFVHTLLSTIHACFGNYDIVHYHCLGPALFSFLPDSSERRR
jgi:hypothetical protein